MGYGYEWRPYVSVAQRRQRAARHIAKLRKSGRVVSPVEIEGRKIARTFWGESWCRNLEAYSDYSNRLPRGRAYARNGSVIDLQIEAGRVQALVSGSSFYQVDIEITPLAKKRWKAIKSQCAGKIDSMVELLRGSISKGVMEIVTRHGEGLFPAPSEITLNCSCPDWAAMCKHVAAALYGVGARLDHEPEMLFTLRAVEPTEMIAAVVADVPSARKRGRGRLLKTDDMSSVFGIDLDLEPGAGSVDGEGPRSTRRGRKKAITKTARKKVAKARSPAVPKRGSAARTKTTSASGASASDKKPLARKTRAAATKLAAKKTVKASARKAATKKVDVTTRQKASTKKASTKKASAKKASAKKASAKKASAKKASTKKAHTRIAISHRAVSTRSRKTP